MKPTPTQVQPSNALVRNCLIGIVTTDQNLHEFLDHGHYRIPARAIGRSLAARALEETELLALYQTQRLADGLSGAIEIYGEITERRVATRREIIPSEPNHPSANELYHLLRVEEVRHLERPIVSRRSRRFVFLRTTRERLFTAVDLNDLVLGTAAEEQLWQGLCGESVHVERRSYIRCSGMVMEVDFAVFGNRGVVGVICGEHSNIPAEVTDVPEAWRVVRFSEARLNADLVGCVGEVVELLRGVGL
jgi:hypothetical protein